MTQRERMLSGGLYSAADPELFRLRQEARRLTRLYNQTAEDQPEERRRLLEALLGGGVVVLPGVTIGAGAVIAAGAVVTRDIPSGVLAAGVPCRVLRPLNERDRTYWRGLQKVWRQD